MKRTSIIILALSISFLTLAQSSEVSSGDLDNKFYFRFAYSHAATSYIGVDDVEFWDYFNRAGGVFEIGHIFIIDQAALGDGLRLGINVDYAEFSYHQLTEIDAEVDFAVGLLKLASKVGPSLSYSPAEHLVFDVFFKAKIPWVAGIALWSDEVDEVFLANPAIGFATGINVRYRFLMLGFEFNSDKMKFESQDYPGEYFGNVSDDSNKTPMPSFSFSLGFCF